MPTGKRRAIAWRNAARAVEDFMQGPRDVADKLGNGCQPHHKKNDCVLALRPVLKGSTSPPSLGATGGRCEVVRPLGSLLLARSSRHS